MDVPCTVRRRERKVDTTELSYIKVVVVVDWRTSQDVFMVVGVCAGIAIEIIR